MKGAQAYVTQSGHSVVTGPPDQAKPMMPSANRTEGALRQGRGFKESVINKYSDWNVSAADHAEPMMPSANRTGGGARERFQGFGD